MGGGSWSSATYTTSTADRRSRGVKDFGHDHDVSTGIAHGIHETLDPSKMINGIRESRDSDEHPESLPVMVMFDVTASMGHIPQILQTKLVNVMDVIIEKAELKHPQILIGAIGDTTCDSHPFQIGQFESDNRFDEQLRNIILEGGGGGQIMESYALAYRFGAYHTITDSLDKRGKKGYLFTMGDEKPWPTLPAEHAKEIFGIGPGNTEVDQTIEVLLRKAQAKWEVYHMMSLDGSYQPGHHSYNNIHEAWVELLGERVILVEDSSLIAEIISGVIHMQESAYDVGRVMDDIGLTGDNRTMVENALVPLASGVTAVVGTGALPPGHGA